MSLSEARQRLSAEQAELVHALVGGGETPAGFDAERLRLAARSLINKRIRETALVWPALARCLGESYSERFALYAAKNPPPPRGGPLADGRAFAATLPAGELDDESRMELMLADLYRRRLPVRVRWLPGSGRLLLGVRLPWLGMRVVGLRLRAW
jgi:hypothetical protein